MRGKHIEYSCKSIFFYRVAHISLQLAFVSKVLEHLENDLFFLEGFELL